MGESFSIQVGTEGIRVGFQGNERTVVHADPPRTIAPPPDPPKYNWDRPATLPPPPPPSSSVTENANLFATTHHQPNRDDRFLAYLRRVEGYKPDPQSGRYHASRSVEGRNDTIGHGHKLSDSEVASGVILIGDTSVPYKSGLTHDQAERLLQQDVSVARRGAARVFEATENKSFDLLPAAHRDVLTDVQFNCEGGLKGFPNLMKAAASNNREGVIQESHRVYTPDPSTCAPLKKCATVPLKDRNEQMERYVRESEQ